MTNFRSIWAALGPPWTRRYWGERLWGATAYFQDLIAEGMTQAARAGWLKSSTYPVDALPIHGEERQIPRVSTETAAQYRARLVDAWNIWPQAGTLTFADNVLEPFGVDPAHVEIRAHLTPGWVPHAFATDFSRFWVIIDEPAPTWTITTVGASWFIGVGETIGSSATPDEIKAVHDLLWHFKSGHELPCGVFLVWGWMIGHWTIGAPTVIGASSIRWPMCNLIGGAPIHTVGDHEAYNPTEPSRIGARLYF